MTGSMAGPAKGRNDEGRKATGRRTNRPAAAGRTRGWIALLLGISMVAVTACGSAAAGQGDTAQPGSSGSGTEPAEQVEPARAGAKVVAADPTAVPEPVGKISTFPR